MKRLIAIGAAALVVAACDNRPLYDFENRQRDNQDNQHARSAADGPVFQLPVLPSRPGAAYFSVEVPVDHGALIGVTSPQAGRIEMHESIPEGSSMSGMRPLERIAPENGRIVMARGSRHLMLFDVNQSLAAGGTAQLVLRFEHGQTRTLQTRVIDAAEMHVEH